MMLLFTLVLAGACGVKSAPSRPVEGTYPGHYPSKDIESHEDNKTKNKGGSFFQYPNRVPN